ncbi:stage III sporulation protein AA [Gottschalkia purinilytica]|uniref:Stage III sporulation protein AA n=1 Tax=Gottschalkia purinilytica TaxID=1503 RepID=A0A0L0W7D8_GOTPU|nr:stage III sporulation protein AA [Gottschalkia purinilytica]KNF07391.1 stage III sporulation protein AA [Gottschalkia purinilytica]
MVLSMNKNFIKKDSLETLSFNGFSLVIQYIDLELKELLEKIPSDISQRIEEIRLRVNRPLMIYFEGKDYFLSKNGQLLYPHSSDLRSDEYFLIEPIHIINTFQVMSNYSVYSIENELKRGFITIKGGHRIGIAGRMVYGENNIETMKDISSINIRIARQKLGVSNKFMKYILKDRNTIYHTLIVSPPQCGKTTILRDLIRNISNGYSEYNFSGLKVGVIDERSEIANMYNGQPQNDIGVRTDVLDGCNKYDGLTMLIRSMSPNVIATDEVGDLLDIKAIHEAIKAGVKVIATVHGQDIEDIKTRPNLKNIIKENIFERIIILDNSKGIGTVKDIIDGKSYESILKKEGLHASS